MTQTQSRERAPTWHKKQIWPLLASLKRSLDELRAYVMNCQSLWRP